MKDSILNVTHFAVTFSENRNEGGLKQTVDPKKALAQLFIDDSTEFFKGKEGKEFDEAKRLKPKFPENKYHLCHLYYQEPDYQQARFRYLYVSKDIDLARAGGQFEPEKFGQVYLNLDMSGEEPTLDIFSMSDFTTEEILSLAKHIFVDMVGKQLFDMGYTIQLEGKSKEESDIDIMTIETMITQPGPIMEKIYSKNAN